jgi:predicted nucleotidyltransferase
MPPREPFPWRLDPNQTASGKPGAVQSFDLQRDLEALFGREVDLMEDRPIANPYLRASLREQRRPLYPGS